MNGINNIRPWRITLDTNPDDCNFKCVMCEDHSCFSQTQAIRKEAGKPKRRMSLELLEKSINEAAEMGVREVIPSTMGEPLMFEYFPNLIDLIEKNRMKMNLTTNGSFPKGGVEKWAELIIPITSDIKVSWNASGPELDKEIMLGSNWNKRVNNLKNLINYRDKHYVERNHYCRITLQMTFMEKNIEDIPNIILFAVKLGVDRLKGHHLWAHFDEIKNESLTKDRDSIIRWNSIVDKAHKLVEENPLQNGKKLLLENFFKLNPDNPGEVSQGDCPFLGKEVWVNHEGRIDPCCAPDEKRKLLGSLGNINDFSISEILHGNVYRKLVMNYKEYPVCKSCNMRKPPE